MMQHYYLFNPPVLYYLTLQSTLINIYSPSYESFDNIKVNLSGLSHYEMAIFIKSIM